MRALGTVAMVGILAGIFVFVVRAAVEAMRSGLAQRMLLDVVQSILPPRRLDASEIEDAICRRVMARCSHSAGGTLAVPPAVRVSLSRRDWEVLHRVPRPVVTVGSTLAARIAAEARHRGRECPDAPVLSLVVTADCRDGWPSVEVPVRQPAPAGVSVDGRSGSRAAANEPVSRGGTPRTGGDDSDAMTRTMTDLDATHLLESPVDETVLLPAHALGPRGAAVSDEVLVLRDLDTERNELAVRGGERVDLGRAHSPLLQNAPTVSARHAIVERRDTHWWITDLRSRNGTLVNGQIVMTSQLEPGDIVQLGGDSGPRFAVSVGQAAELPQPVERQPASSR